VFGSHDVVHEVPALRTVGTKHGEATELTRGIIKSSGTKNHASSENDQV